MRRAALPQTARNIAVAEGCEQATQFNSNCFVSKTIQLVGMFEKLYLRIQKMPLKWKLLLGIQSVVTICIGVHRYKIITDNQKMAERRLMVTNQVKAAEASNTKTDAP